MSTQALRSPAEPVSAAPHRAVRRHIRGSSLLLVGRMLAKGLNFAVQVVIVRFLTKADYGALAYALAIVALLQNVAALGLDRSVTRFVAIYQEQKAYDKLLGTLLMAVGAVVSFGLVLIAGTYACQGFLVGSLIRDPQVLPLLLLLVFLVPLEALDNLMVGLFAVLASPGAIFFRKHVLAPGLRLVVVLLLFLGRSNVYVVALGYLLTGILGTAIGAAILYQMLRRKDLLQHFRLRHADMPWGEILAFTIPWLSSEILLVLMHTMDVVLLEKFGSVSEVAAFRAVQPLSVMNQLVMASFATLFVPSAARMFAREDREGINSLYWQTAAWIAILSYPIFALTTSLCQPITTFLYGARYEQSAAVLALLSFGCYLSAATGFNGLTLKVCGKMRYIVIINLIAAVLNFCINLFLIPRYGALGAAMGTCFTLTLHNTLKQIGLRWCMGIQVFERRYLSVYLTIALSAAALWLVQAALAPPVYVGIFLAGVASLAVLWSNRRLLEAGEMFPELLRVPLLRQLLRR